MKKLLTLTICLIASFAFAQDITTINKMVSSSSVDEITTVSNLIIQDYSEKQTLFKIKEVTNGTEFYQIAYYFPSDEKIIDDKPTDDQKGKVTKINFGQSYIGENKDLEIKGKLNFYFREVYGSYLDLVEFWIKTFYPNNTKEEILSDYKLKEYRVNKDVKFKLMKQGETWKIYRSY